MNNSIKGKLHLNQEDIKVFRKIPLNVIRKTFFPKLYQTAIKVWEGKCITYNTTVRRDEVKDIEELNSVS